MLSQLRSIEQQRAAQAWAYVQAAKQKRYAKEYGALARSAPADIQANGLGQTLAFWRAKGFADSQPKDQEYSQLFEDVSEWLRRRLPQIKMSDVVEWIATKAGTDDYRRATVEAIAFLVWVKRFAEAELPKAGG